MNTNQKITLALWSYTFQNFSIPKCPEIYPYIFRFPILPKWINGKKKEDDGLPPGYIPSIFTESAIQKEKLILHFSYFFPHEKFQKNKNCQNRAFGNFT